MVIGKGGSVLKQVGERARAQLPGGHVPRAARQGRQGLAAPARPRRAPRVLTSAGRRAAAGSVGPSERAVRWRAASWSSWWSSPGAPIEQRSRSPRTRPVGRPRRARRWRGSGTAIGSPSSVNSDLADALEARCSVSTIWAIASALVAPGMRVEDRRRRGRPSTMPRVDVDVERSRPRRTAVSRPTPSSPAGGPCLERGRSPARSVGSGVATVAAEPAVSRRADRRSRAATGSVAIGVVVVVATVGRRRTGSVGRRSVRRGRRGGRGRRGRVGERRAGRRRRSARSCRRRHAARRARRDDRRRAPARRSRAPTRSPHRSTSVGSRTTKRAPPPGRSSTHASPPRARGVLGDERQAEPGADPVPGRAAAGEALEDPRPLAGGDAGPGVLDRHQHGSLPPAGSIDDPQSARRRGAWRSRAGWRGSARTAPGRRSASTRAAPAVDVDRQVAVAVAVRRPGRTARRGRPSSVCSRWRRRRSATARAGRSPCRRTGAPGSTTTSSACCVRSGRSSRRASSTSTAADRAVIGERSSWLTSDAKRASRSIRACTASAMSLNESARRSRSGSLSGSSRVSRPPDGDLAGGVGDPAQRAQQAAAGPPADERGQQRR